MTGSTIKTTITTGVTVGGAIYPSPLTITAAGTVAPTVVNATAVYAAAATPNVSLNNQGAISGGGGGYGGNAMGGDGVDFLASANLTNTGTISGGNAGPYGTSSDQGGIGVNLAAGGTLTNAGTISGGMGGEYAGGNLKAGHGGPGGDGVSMASGTLTNTGAIYGGTGGTGGNSLSGGFGGNGAYGVDLAGGSLINSGTITGGAGGANGGDYAGAGIFLGAGAAAANNATILGGQGGNNTGYNLYGDAGFFAGNGAYGAIVAGGTLTDNGTITGGNGGIAASTDGAGRGGVEIKGGTLIAAGTISGGFNGGGGQADAVVFVGTAAGMLVLEPGAGFSGIVAGDAASVLELGASTTATTLTGLGTQYTGFGQISIASGGNWTLPGSFTGGTGDQAVNVAAGATLTTSGGVIAGGTGLYGTAARAGGAGSGAITLSANDSLINRGSIAGGHGGDSSGSIAAGGGGPGVGIATNDSVTNYGTISGGNGGYNYSTANGGAGGNAVDLAGGTLTNIGSIAGGSGGREAANGLAGVAAGDAMGGFGVDLSAGASVTNDGTITGGFLGGGAYLNGAALINYQNLAGGYRADGAYLINGATLTNNATIAGGSGLGNAIVNGGITGPVGNGVVLKSGAALTNNGTITSGFGGLGALLNDSALINNGTITGGASLTAGASMANYGVLTSSGAGASLATGTTLHNDGAITGGEGADGVDLAAGASLTNLGTIMGGGAFNPGHGGARTYGVDLKAGGQVTNIGTLEGGYEGGGAYLSGGTLLNTGSIEDGAHAVGVLLNGGTLITSGTIAGAASYTRVVPPFTAPNGHIYGGTYTIPGYAAVRFGSIAADLVVDPGAVFTGSVVATATAGDTLELGTGTVAGTLTGLGSSITGFGTIAFDTGADWFLAGNTSGLAGTITGFARGDTIEITGITVTGSSYVNGVLTLTETSGAATLDLPGRFATADFLVTNAAAGADVTLAPICYLPGTLIATPLGEMEVERLAPGDMALTLSGEARRIVWVGTGRVLATRGRRSAATPVIVRKGALGDNVPHSDLRVTKAHALYIDGVLVPVEFLVNHRTILWDDHAQEVTIYHIELETHDVLLANGAPAESYRDDGNRWLFQNANSGWDFPPREPCAPVLTGGAVVDAIWRRLLDRAGPRRSLPLTDDADLHLVVDGRRLNAAERAGDVHVFRLTAAPSSLRIVSRSAAPAELGLARDPRSLGVALRRLVVRKGTRFRAIKADDDRLSDGFHAFEVDSGMRWTDGDAVLQADLYAGVSGPFEVVLHTGGTTLYRADDPVQHVA
jgi:hypothetical protein